MSQRPIDIGRAQHFGRRQYSNRHEFSAREVRQGRIVLNTPRRRTVFIAGLVIALLVAFVFVYLA